MCHWRACEFWRNTIFRLTRPSSTTAIHLPKSKPKKRKRACARAHWVCEQSVSFWLISLRTTRPHHADSTRETYAACVMVWLSWKRKPEVKNIVCDGRAMVQRIEVIHAKCVPLSHEKMGGLRSIGFRIAPFGPSDSASMMIFYVICHKTIKIFFCRVIIAPTEIFTYLTTFGVCLVRERRQKKSIPVGHWLIFDSLHKSPCSDYRLVWWSCEMNRKL